MTNSENSFFNEITFESIIFILTIIIIIGFLNFIIRKTFPRIADQFSGKKRIYILSTMPMLRLFLLLIAIIMIFPVIIRTNTENLLAFFGAMGIVIGFAFKDYTSSIIAGIVATYEMQFRPGDWVEIEGISGEVKTTTLRSVQLTTPDDSAVYIPYQSIWNKPIFNATSGTGTLMCVTDFYLQPDQNPNLVKQILYDVTLSSPYVNHKYSIQIIVTEKPWYTHYKVKTYPVDSRLQFLFMSDITVRGKIALTEAKIELATVRSKNLVKSDILRT